MFEDTGERICKPSYLFSANTQQIRFFSLHDFQYIESSKPARRDLKQKECFLFIGSTYYKWFNPLSIWAWTSAPHHQVEVVHTQSGSESISKFHQQVAQMPIGPACSITLSLFAPVSSGGRAFYDQVTEEEIMWAWFRKNSACNISIVWKCMSTF